MAFHRSLIFPPFYKQRSNKNEFKIMSKDHRFALVISTSNDDEDINNDLEAKLKTSFEESRTKFGVVSHGWKSGHEYLDRSLKVNNYGNDNDLERKLHSLLDQLNNHLNNDLNMLDILWIIAKIPKEFPIGIYGVLKRAVAWNAAKVTIITNNPTGCHENPYLEDINAEVLDPDDYKANLGKVIWRGNLTFTDPENFEFRNIPNFELTIPDSSSAEFSSDEESLTNPDFRISKHLKLIRRIPIPLLPKKMVTDRVYRLRTSHRKWNDTFENDPDLFRAGYGLIARLGYCECNSVPGLEKFNSVDWTQAVTNGNIDDRNPDENLERQLMQWIHFLICKDSDDDNNLVAVQLDASNLHSDSSNNLQPDPSKRESKGESGLRVIESQCLENIAPDSPFSEQVDDSDELNWPERRILSFLEKQKITSGKSNPNSMMTPGSAEVLVLEAKELLKLFNEHKAKLEPLAGLSSAENAEVDQSWPSVLCQDYPGLHYNKSVESEEIDKEAQRLQRTFVGKRETASTTTSNVDNRDHIVVPAKKEATSKRPLLAPKRKLKKSPTQSEVDPTWPLDCNQSVKSEGSDRGTIRSSASQRAAASKMTSNVGQARKGQKGKLKTSPTQQGQKSKSKEDIYRQKLRNAVYEALESKGVDEKHKLFRGCFRKLFEICKMYAAEMPTGVKSTKLWLCTVAKNNVDTVVNLEIALHGT